MTPVWFFIGSSILCFITGFCLFSRGAVFRSTFGQLALCLLSLIVLGLLAAAFWMIGWKLALVHFVASMAALKIGARVAAN